MVSSAYQYSLCYYTSYIPITSQVSTAKQSHWALIPNIYQSKIEKNKHEQKLITTLCSVNILDPNIMDTYGTSTMPMPTMLQTKA